MTIRHLLLATLLAFLPSCGIRGGKASGTNFEPTGSTGAYRTWAWAPKRTLALSGPSQNHATIQGWLEQAIDAELGLKGLIKADPSHSDLLASYSAGPSQMHTSQELGAQGEHGGARLDDAGGLGGALAQWGILGKESKNGRLTIDLIDRQSGQVLYRGTGNSEIFEKPSARRSIPRIEKAVHKMLEDFRTR